MVYSLAGQHIIFILNRLLSEVVVIHQALYRKWRSLTFDDVVGQSHITDTLKAQISRDKLSHAYLFTGTRGTGKTSCAKILARAVNCENPQNGEPCNKCPSCLGILSEQITDVSEIDAASNSRVDDVRAMLDEVAYTPASVKKRVYIIDEVHMLSVSAFNALLKTLEEPPAHVLFILATTEVHKLPATILSRCQRFDFKRISAFDIAKRLLKISQAENIPLSKEGADAIARLGDGSMRDSLSILERCAAADTELTEAAVNDILGLAGQEYALKVMSAVADKDIYTALSAFSECYRSGREAASLIDELSVLARDLMIIKTAPSAPADLLDMHYSKDKLAAIANAVDMGRMLYIIRLLSDFTARLRQSTDKRLEAEMCIMSMCADEPTAVCVQPQQSKAKTAAPKAAQPQSRVEKPQPIQAKPIPKGEDLSDKWSEIFAAAKPKLAKHVIALLSLCTVKISGGEVSVYSDGGMTNDVLKSPEKAILAEAAEQILGQPFRVGIKNENPDALSIGASLEKSLEEAERNGVRVEYS